MKIESDGTCIQNGCNACCTDSRLRLTLKEANFLRSNGTILQAPFHVNGRKNIIRNGGKAYFDMEGPCGFLSEEGLCLIHDDPNRPTACQNLKPYSRECTDLRADQGLHPIVLYDATDQVSSEYL